MAVRYEQIIQEDLNVGTSRVYVGAPAGGKMRATQVGIHTPAVGQRAWTKTWSPGAIAASGSATTTITVTDAAVGALVMASHDKILTSALTISAHVSAADTVKVVIANPTTASITPASGTLRVVVFDTKDLNVFTCSLALVVDAAVTVDLDEAGEVTVSAADFDDGSTGVAYWQIEVFGGGQSSEITATASAATLSFDCDDLPSVVIQINAWGGDPDLYPDCTDSDYSALTLNDLFHVCSA